MVMIVSGRRLGSARVVRRLVISMAMVGTVASGLGLVVRCKTLRSIVSAYSHEYPFPTDMINVDQLAMMMYLLLMCNHDI